MTTSFERIDQLLDFLLWQLIHIWISQEINTKMRDLSGILIQPPLLKNRRKTSNKNL